LRIFKTRWFDRFARREAIGDPALVDAVKRAASGLVDADLGGGLIKQRIARQGQGRSGGFRVILTARFGDSAFFLYGFSKNERENIGIDELRSLRLAAVALLSAEKSSLEDSVARGLLKEVSHGE
jgi:hypothetical protein